MAGPNFVIIIKSLIFYNLVFCLGVLFGDFILIDIPYLPPPGLQFFKVP